MNCQPRTIHGLNVREPGCFCSFTWYLGVSQGNDCCLVEFPLARPEMKFYLPCVLVLCLAGCRPALPTARPSPEADQVVRTAEQLFVAMRTRDTLALRTLFHPGARITAVEGNGAEAKVSERGLAEFVRSIGTARDTLRERMWEPEVRVDGNLATLWAPYDFHFGARFSHCGYDAFHFARAAGGWRITAISYTVQRDGCPTPRP
ncbi:MAG: nuclear transport factor 2 family protein [Ferruginibacter sp.]|nr:nuclear transport factor 2 family protein [Cytophagales bacterium]